MYFQSYLNTCPSEQLLYCICLVCLERFLVFSMVMDDRFDTVNLVDMFFRDVTEFATYIIEFVMIKLIVRGKRFTQLFPFKVACL